MGLAKDNLFLRVFARLKIPLIAHVRPTVLAYDDEQVVIRVPLGRRTRNHHGSMYFGALAIGADLAAGYAAMRTIEDRRKDGGHQVSFVFKDVQAEFLRRPDGDVHFTCRENKAVRALIDKTIHSGEREELTVPVVCTVPKTSGEDPVARFRLTISVKRR